MEQQPDLWLAELLERHAAERERAAMDKTAHAPIYQITLRQTHRFCMPTMHGTDVPRTFQRAIAAEYGGQEPDRDILLVAGISERDELVGINVVTIGDLRSCYVSQPELWAPLILMRASRAIMAFKRGPGSYGGAQDIDPELVTRMIQAGALLSIPVRDVLVLGEGAKWASIRKAFPRFYDWEGEWEDIGKARTKALEVKLKELEEDPWVGLLVGFRWKLRRLRRRLFRK